MRRRIEFVEATGLDSLGRNGRMTTVGCSLVHLPGPVRPIVGIMPLNSRGDAGRAEIYVDAEAAGEVGAFLIEAFCRHATPEARARLLERLATICDGNPDPERVAEAEEPADGAAGPRFR